MLGRPRWSPVPQKLSRLFKILVMVKTKHIRKRLPAESDQDPQATQTSLQESNISTSQAPQASPDLRGIFIGS